MMSRLIPRVPVNFMTSCQQIGHMTKWCVIPVRIRVVYASQTISDVWPSLQTEISEDPAVHGSTLVPILLGSDKTIASVMTGNVKYYPLYMSIRNLHNDIRHAHRGGVAAIGFLAIPTCESSVMSIGMYVNLLHFTGEKKDEKTKDFTMKLMELEMEAQDKLDSQEESFKKYFEEERVKFVQAYREKLDRELHAQSEIINER